MARAPAFYQELAERVLANARLVEAYRCILEKGRILNTEFLENTWPDYYADLGTLREITGHILSLEPALTPEEISKVYTNLRIVLGYHQRQ